MLHAPTHHPRAFLALHFLPGLLIQGMFHVVSNLDLVISMFDKVVPRFQKTLTEGRRVAGARREGNAIRLPIRRAVGDVLMCRLSDAKSMESDSNLFFVC